MVRWDCLIAVLFLSAPFSWSHPVAFKGSTGAMTSMAPESTEIQMNYSLSPRFALGGDYVRMMYREDDVYFGIVRANALVYRANRPESQGNIYLYTGTGVREASGDSDAAFFYGGEADWESRKHYVSFKGQSWRSPNRLNFDQFVARAGIAPYVAGFESLHTWLIAQGMYEPWAKNQFTWAPMVRMFYRNVLWETGVSTRGEFLFNTIIHF